MCCIAKWIDWRLYAVICGRGRKQYKGNRVNGFIGEQILLWCKPSAKWNEKGYYITLNADCGVYLNVGAGADGAGDGMVRAKAGNNGASFFPAGEWVHLAVTFDSDSNDAAIYRNGEKQKINYAGADKFETNSREYPRNKGYSKQTTYKAGFKN